jgi:hypothetical protein
MAQDYVGGREMTVSQGTEIELPRIFYIWAGKTVIGVTMPAGANGAVRDKAAQPTGRLP